MPVVSQLPARKAALSVGVISVVTALLVTGCGATPPPSAGQPAVQESPSVQVSTDANGADYVQVCEDTETQQRVEDEHCEGDLTNTHYRPSYYGYDSMIPAIGTAMLVGFLLSPPARSTVYRGAAPRTGGYAPKTRPNSGFLKVPDDFVGGPPVVPPAPSSAPNRVPQNAPSGQTVPSEAKPTAAAPKKEADKKVDKKADRKTAKTKKFKTRRK